MNLEFWRPGRLHGHAPMRRIRSIHSSRFHSNAISKKTLNRLLVPMAMALATAFSAPGTAIVVMAVIVAMVMVPAAVVPAMGPAVRVAAAGRWLLHKIHRLAAGVIACAVLAPVLGMAGRHVHVNGRTGHHHRRALDDDWLCV